MSTNLTRVQSGIVGVQPGLLLLQTSFTNAQIQVPGFLNSIEGNAAVSVLGSDFLFANASDGNEYYVVETVGTQFVLVPAGGTGGGFQYENAYWVAQNGSDTANDGKSIDSPFLTIERVLSIAPAGVLTIINIQDGGTYSQLGFTIRNNTSIFINAPAATLVNSGIGSMFSYASGGPATLVVNANKIENAGKNLFNYTNGLTTTIYANSITGNFNNNTLGTPADIFLFAKDGTLGSVLISTNTNTIVDIGFGTITGNVTDTGAAVGFDPQVYINARAVGGNILSNNLRIYGTVQDVIGTMTNIKSGFFNGKMFGESYRVVYQTPPSGSWSFLAGGPESANSIVLITNTNGTLLLPQGLTTTLGYRIFSYQTPFSSGAQVQTQGLDTMVGQGFSGTTSAFTGRGLQQYVNGGNNGGGGVVWVCAGLFGTNVSAFPTNVFISKVNGSDVTGDGTPGNPFASINAALAYVIANFGASPVNTINLVIADDASYNETLNFSATSGINLIGREASIAYSGAGSAVITPNTGAFIIALASLSTTGGAATLTDNGTGGVVANIDLITGGDIHNTSTGTLLLQTFIISANITNPGGGEVAYSCLIRAGSDGPGVNGTSAVGTLENWNVGGTLVASGLTYPIADGTIGQAMVTNGAGALSFATVGGGGLTFNNVAGTSQLAVVNNAYVCQNAAQTTVTLPAVAAEGAVVKIYGQGAGGWVAQANGGQTILFGTGASSSGGTATSSAGTDCASFVCLVANTSWTIDSAVTAGLTLA